MPIRPARWKDIPIMAQVLAASFGPDSLFQVMFPHQDEYPEDLVTAFRRTLKVSWWDYSKVLMVSYEQDSPSNPEKALVTTRNSHEEVITGFVEWQRAGVGWESVWNISAWDPRHLIGKFMQWRSKLLYWLKPCRAAARPTKEDPDPLLFGDFVRRLMPYGMYLLCDPSKPWRSNHWSLEVLGIHPSWQGKGHGKELAQWGLAKAKCDIASGVVGLPSVVIAADGKEVFYQKVGFNELVGWSSRSVEGVPGRNPLEERGVGGGAVLWSWVREDEEAAKENFEPDSPADSTVVV